MITSRPARSRALTLLATVALAATAVACGSDDDALDVDTDVDVAVSNAAGVVDSVAEEASDQAQDLAQTLRDNGLDSAASIVERIDPSELIAGENFTFFAPDDAAFTTLDSDDMADLLSDPAQILDVLRNHTLSETVMADALVGETSVATEAGETVTVSVDGDTVTLGEDVTVVTTDIEVGDGVIHVVDGFLLP